MFPLVLTAFTWDSSIPLIGIPNKELLVQGGNIPIRWLQRFGAWSVRIELAPRTPKPQLELNSNYYILKNPA